MKGELPGTNVRKHQSSELALRNAVEGLSDNELEPLERLVRRRLLEDIASPLGLDGQDAPAAVNAKTLRDVCERVPDVVVSLPRHEDTASLTDHVRRFVDVNSRHGTYPGASTSAPASERVCGSTAGARSQPSAASWPNVKGKTASSDDRHGESLPIATLDDVRVCLPEMLDISTCPAEGAMYLSQVMAQPPHPAPERQGAQLRPIGS